MPLNRRELIALLLGAPALTVAGCSKSPIIPPAGELLGQSLEIGHRLRDGFRPQPAPDAWNEVSVVIVGGGAAGLSAAWRLAQAGFQDYVILELEGVTGGTSRSGSSALTPYPWGAHYVPVPFAENQRLIQLISDMDMLESININGSPVVREQYLCREPEERLYFQGEWIEGLYPTTDASEEDLLQLSAFRKEIDRWTAWRDPQGRRAFAIPISMATDAAEVLELDKLSMSEWLRQHGWDSPRLHWLIDYSCRDDYGLTADQTSAWAGILYFAARQPAPGSDHQPLMTWPAGNGHLIKFLTERAGPKVHSNAAVAQITPGSIKPEENATLTWFDTETNAVHGIRAKQIIFAAPQFLAPRLISGFASARGTEVADFRYGSWIVANLHLSDRPQDPGFPISWDNVIHDSKSLGYVVSTHQSGRDHGATILTWYYPYTDNDIRQVRNALMEASWSDLADVVLTDLEVAHPEIRKLTTRIDVFRWGHAMIRPTVNFISGESRRQAKRPFGRVHFANTDLSGIALFEEAFDHGCRAANEVLEALS